MHELKYLQRPNCPENTVKHILIGSKYKGLYEAFFEKFDIIPIYIENNKDVDPRLSGHVDLSVFHAGNDEFVVAQSIKQSLINQLNLHKLTANTMTCMPQSTKYPNDCNINVCYTGDYLICNNKVADKLIVNLLTNRLDNSKLVINVNQGYTKCNICVIDSNSIITGDAGIATECTTRGLNVLLVNNDWINLNGFNHGFIGGCTFKLSKDKIAFTGIIDNKIDEERIKSFLNERKIEMIYMSNNKINDIGGIIPITEYYE